MRAGSLGDLRPHPTEDALVQLGRALMTELVDVISDRALEDYQQIISLGPLGNGLGQVVEPRGRDHER